MEYKKLIGQRIQKRRVIKGYKTQAALAEALDVNTSSVSNIETGKHIPRGKKLKNLLSKLDLTQDQLFSVNEDPPQVDISKLSATDIVRMYYEERSRAEILEGKLMGDDVSARFANAAPNLQNAIRALLGLAPLHPPKKEPPKSHKHSVSPKKAVGAKKSSL